MTMNNNSIKNIHDLIAYITIAISENETLRKKIVQVKDWMVQLQYFYDNFYDKWTDVDEVFLIVVRLYQILRYDIGEEKTINLRIFLEHLMSSIFVRETFVQRDIELITSFIVDSFLECDTEIDEDDAEK